MKKMKQAANRWAVSLAVSGTMILSLTFGILPIHAAAEERVRLCSGRRRSRLL